MIKTIRLSVLAGLLISLAASIFLQVENKILGSFLFSIGLFSVIILEANLYTGKIGYVNSKEKIINALVILGFNLLTAFICGFIYRSCFGVATRVMTKMDKDWWKLLVDSIICGVCIYLGVECYKKNWIMVIFSIMTFILLGADHCVANIFYLSASNMTNWLNFGRLALVIIGNSIGSLLVRCLQVGFGGMIDEIRKIN